MYIIYLVMIVTFVSCVRLFESQHQIKLFSFLFYTIALHIYDFRFENNKRTLCRKVMESLRASSL